MGAMVSQITDLFNVCSTVYSGAGQRKCQSSAALAFVMGIHRWPVDSPKKKTSNAENVSIWWRHNAYVVLILTGSEGITCSWRRPAINRGFHTEGPESYRHRPHLHENMIQTWIILHHTNIVRNNHVFITWKRSSNRHQFILQSNANYAYWTPLNFTIRRFICSYSITSSASVFIYVCVLTHPNDRECRGNLTIIFLDVFIMNTPYPRVTPYTF